MISVNLFIYISSASAVFQYERSGLKYCFPKALPYPDPISARPFESRSAGTCRGPHLQPSKRGQSHRRYRSGGSHTAAIHSDNPEFAAIAQKAAVPTRAQLLGQIMRNYQTPWLSAALTGKTTTTSMIALRSYSVQQTDPTLSIGGIPDSIERQISGSGNPDIL